MTSDTRGVGDYYVPGTVGVGYLTFDDSLIPVGGTGTIGDRMVGHAALDLAFSWYVHQQHGAQ